MTPQSIRAIGIPNLPAIKAGDDISKHIMTALELSHIRIANGDIIVIASKIVSKAEGRIIHGASVEISNQAREIAEINGFDPIQVELALRESKEVIRTKGVLITETHSGIVCNFSGVDKSNVPAGQYILLPKDPDASAARIHVTLEKGLNKHIAVIITDTQGRPWRRGSLNIAIGCAGISPFKYNRGKKDLYGRTLERSTVCQVDELAALAEPLMGQAGQGIPIIIIKGYSFSFDNDSARDINRPKNQDVFR
ncbi:MAG: coenzyme F420-0:L-glutamate ligase [Candidatus Odinarchaeota archaeon]